ncbi:MAG: RNase H family protein [Pyrinomonadaceae bacterium]
MSMQNCDRSENGGIKIDDYHPVVTIYADASCLRNGAPDASAGCGAVIIDSHRMDIRLIAKYLGSVTNQQAEILACSTALGELRRPCIVDIISDSQYVIETMTGKNQMKLNRSLWSELVTKCYGHHVTWRWVKGHSGVALHEVADRLSRAASTYQCSLPDEELIEQAVYVKENANDLIIQEFERNLNLLARRYSLASQFNKPFNNGNISQSLPSAFSAQ